MSAACRARPICWRFSRRARPARRSTRRRSTTRLAAAVREVVEQQVAAGHRQRLRRRAEQDLLHLLCPPPPVRDRRGARRRHRQAAADRGASRPRRPSRFPGAAAPARGGTSWFSRRRGAVLHRSGHLSRPRAARNRSEEPRRRLRRGEAGRGLYERRLARGADQIRAGSLLPERRRLCRSAGRGAAARNTRRSTRPGSSCRSTRRISARPGTTSISICRTPSSCASPSATSRRSTTRPRNIPPEAMRMHHLLGQLRGAAHPRHPARDDVRRRMRARPQALLFEAANPRHAHEWEDLRGAKIPDDKILMPGLHRLDDQFRRAPAADRAADLQLRQHRRARAGRSPAPIAALPPSPRKNAVAPSVVWAKLAALAEGARIASDRLWK